MWRKLRIEDVEKMGKEGTHILNFICFSFGREENQSVRVHVRPLVSRH